MGTFPQKNPDAVFAFHWFMQGVPEQYILEVAKRAAYDAAMVRRYIGKIRASAYRPVPEPDFERRLRTLAAYFRIRSADQARASEGTLIRATTTSYPEGECGTVRGVPQGSSAYILFSLGVPGDRILLAAHEYAERPALVAEYVCKLWDHGSRILFPGEQWKVAAQTLSIYLSSQKKGRKDEEELLRMSSFLYSRKGDGELPEEEPSFSASA